MGTFIEYLKAYENSLKINKKGITITLSGLSGSGKTTIAEVLAKNLNLKLINSGDIYRSLAEESKVSLEEFSAKHNDEVDYEIDKRSLKFAKEGNVLIVGRLAGWVAGDNADLKIFVKCSLKERAKRVALREGKTFEEAKKDILARDKSDINRAKKLYGINLKDLSIYDLIINNDKLSFEEAKIIPVKKVQALLKKKALLI